MARNEPASALTHLIAAVLSAFGLALLVTVAALTATAWHVVGLSVFGGALILLYVASATYHFLGHGLAKRVMRRIDHAMIYVLIAGTYTPLCLTVLRGAWGWTLLGVIWGVALGGIILKSSGVFLPVWLSTTLYVLMGWLAVTALAPLMAAIGWAGMVWMLIGGVAYTVGALVYWLETQWPRKGVWGLHEWFHILIMIGSLSHFWLMWNYVL